MRRADERLEPERVAEALRRALTEGHAGADDPVVLLYDEGEIAARSDRLRACFPAGTLHAAAVKAVALPSLLAIASRLGLGAEAASAGELALCAAAGFGAERVVFDSPAKTRSEIASALGAGVALNADNLDELARIAELRPESCTSTIGVRINPQVGIGAIEATSVAGRFSKFGVPITEAHAQLVAAFRSHPWLTMVHVHVGSQGTTADLLTGGVRGALGLAGAVGAQVDTIDIGGGLPVSYREGSAPVITLESYAERLRSQCPSLFDGSYRLVTEFGRWLFANAGSMACRVEYVKEVDGRRIAVVQAGADLFVRPAYRPEDWFHEIEVFDADGVARSGATTPCTVAGPLCFAGDLLARDRLLPPIEAGDWLVVRDAGAYTLSMVSRYNSRALPKVLLVDRDPGAAVTVLKERERSEDIVRFWS